MGKRTQRHHENIYLTIVIFMYMSRSTGRDKSDKILKLTSKHFALLYISLTDMRHFTHHRVNCCLKGGEGGFQCQTDKKNDRNSYFQFLAHHLWIALTKYIFASTEPLKLSLIPYLLVWQRLIHRTVFYWNLNGMFYTYYLGSDSTCSRYQSGQGIKKTTLNL